MGRTNPVSRAAYKLARHIYRVISTAFPNNRVGFETFEDPDYVQVTFQGPMSEGRRLWGEDFLVVAEEKRQEWLEDGDHSMDDVVILPMGYALVFSEDPGLAKSIGRDVPIEARENPGRKLWDEIVEHDFDLPPRFRAATKIFEGFHSYDVSNVGAMPSSMTIPREVYYAGPCSYVTYRSDKWNEGTYDYIHEIESYPHVALGMVSERHPRTKKVPSRISNDATLVQLNKRALGYGYTDPDDGLRVDATVRGCEWFWHPKGKALLLIQSKRKLLAIIWGGKLGFRPEGIVG